VDLRSVPYSVLVLERRGLRTPQGGGDVAGWRCVLGVPRVYKGFAKLLTCGAAGVEEMEVQRRLAPALLKAMDKGKTPALVRGDAADGRFTRIETRDT
jgi:hypothetical protein